MELTLFGGNMLGHVPTGVLNVSELRQVPDNQEVFVCKTSDQSIIIELLSHVDEPDEQALRTHFEDLAISNDAVGPENSCIMSVQQLPRERLAMTECSSAYCAVCEQRVAKFNESMRNVVRIYLGLLRLPEFDTDIVVTFNDPTSINLESCSKSCGTLASGETSISSAAAAANISPSSSPFTQEMFLECLCSLQLVNPDFLR